jgi:lysophospholipase L1-like esterase
MALRLTAGRVAAAVALGAVAGCGGIHDLRVPSEPGAGTAILTRYVAIGNSITAGYQSGGLNDTTQRRAYPALIAAAAGARFAVPVVTGTACRPLTTLDSAFRSAIGDATVRPAGASCARTSSTDQLNNLAVPGARSADPAGLAGGGSNPLTTLILGGRTQVQRAVELDPTFVSVWIGSNDVLGAAIGGDTTGATPLATFQANYDAMIAALTARSASGTERRGILIGVVDVTNVGALFPAQVLVNNAQFRGAILAAFFPGRQFQFVNCPANTTSLVSLGLIFQLRQQFPPGGTAPVPFACSPTPVSPTTTIGAGGILDAAETAALVARVAAYNAYIQQKAQQIGWAYWNPNTLLASYKASGAITTVPNLLSAVAPFGTALSLDGIHPSSRTHLDVANAIIQTINGFYPGTNIPAATAVATSAAAS